MIGRNIRPAGSFDASFILIILIVVFLAGGIVFALTNLRQDPIEEVLSGDRVINTLFVIEDREKPLASYVLMYYPDTGKAAIFDIPGTVGLILRGIDRVDRIAAIYDPGRISPFEAEIEGLLGVEISFSVITNTEQLGRMVDLIGGVEIFIPSRVAVYDTGNMVFFPSGLTRLDGDKARSYINYQLPDEGPDQLSFRRQRFFLALLKRLGEQNAILKNSEAASQFHTMVKTSMSARVQARFFTELAQLDTDRINIQTVGGNVREVSGQALLFPSYDGSLIKEIVRQSLGSLTRRLEGDLTERVFTVEILNGTTTIGLAGRTAELLRSFGYDVIAIGNADRSDYWDTRIIDRSGFQDMAEIFADIIRCGNIHFESRISDDPGLDVGINLQNLEYKADFTLIIGRDFNGRYVTGG
ncbi:MAG: LCP family protein [Spirochaetaceae bacterium]|jgi:anionic cell wall polymer biosynthesis LytR-Cps2A-Psr (LCP) family protein|nr:LCP family protein [Spirochaetaceae bacterium]